MLSKDVALYVFHHVFLPPKTPQKDDFVPGFGHVFFDETEKALSAFGKFSLDFSGVDMRMILKMVATMRTIHDCETHDVLESELRSNIFRLVDEGTCTLERLSLVVLIVIGGIIPIYVRAQNAGVIMRKEGDRLYFELFEVLPKNEAVTTTQGRLIRSFPDSTVKIGDDIGKDDKFQEQIAKILAQMSHQAVPGQQPQVKKAKEMLDENRDTTHPGMVTEFFQAIISGMGSFVASNSIVKHTREQVSWSDTKMPWRRSPMWSMIRVSLHLAFTRLASCPQAGQLLYKHFMVFLLSHIVRSSPRSQLPSDVLYVMNAKIAHRVNKLAEMDDCLFDAVLQTAFDCNKDITTRWSNKQRNERWDLDLNSLSRLDFRESALLDLPGINNFVRAIQNEPVGISTAQFHPVSRLIQFEPDNLPHVSTRHESADTTLQLHAFENWISDHLSNWREDNAEDPDACVQLAHLLEEYHQVARPVYTGNPEATSIMVLVSLEIWMACDQLATAIEPLLIRYNPGIPSALTQNLLLPFTSQMERLQVVERYLEIRARTLHPPGKLFQDVCSPHAFAARYFDQSAEHQELLREICIHADAEKKAKLAEWRRLQEQYERLMEFHHKESTCQFIEVWSGRFDEESEMQHSPGCRKCHYKTAACNLHISIHEWPLPTHTIEAKTVIFELMVPPWFGRWRDAVVYLRHDILAAEYGGTNGPRSSHPLSKDPHLSMQYFRGINGRGAGRISLLSQNKPHVGTHRRGRELITSTQGNICLSSGLSYQYYDYSVGCFVGDYHPTETVPTACTYKMPPEARALQRFIWRPASEPDGPPPNLVIASQSDCPDHMTIPEYKDLCHIPLGVALQWWDMAAQLTAPTVNFQRIETALVFLQCAYQAGPPSDEVNSPRGAYVLLQDADFCAVLVDGLHESLLRIKDNWQSVASLDVFIAIARRVLPLTTSERVQGGCFRYLAKAREVAMTWIRQLRQRCQEAQSEVDREFFRARFVEAALICASSFNVDAKFYDRVLTTTDASILIQCSILIFYGRITLDSLPSRRIPLLRHHHQRLLHDVYPFLVENHNALDHAVHQACVSYQPSSGWALAEQTTHWMVSQFTSTSATQVSRVHLDLLTGELLVDGSPLNRLPKEYEHEESYKALFGKCTIEVIPYRTPGISYASRDKYRGYELQFGMCKGQHSATSDVVVRAIAGHTTYTLLPSRVFRGTVPDALVDDFIHWYSDTHKAVEFRPRADPWTRNSPQGWLLTSRGEDSEWQLKRARDGAILASLKSETAQRLSHILAPLAKPSQIHICFHTSFSSLKVEFKVLNLAFALTQGESKLYSREFRDMFIDNDQSIGTLVGFRNKLVVREEGGCRRKALLAFGPFEDRSPKTSDDPGVLSTSIDLTKGDIHLYAFDVDARLGQLKGNGSLDSQLVLAYLHANTSFCLQDPLTNKTGTEQALSILQSAAVLSFDKLAEKHLSLLQLIAALTPKRSFYPEDKRDMETITWSSTLGFLSQHSGFYQAVSAIFDQARRSHTLHPDHSIKIPDLNHVRVDLLDRDCTRSAVFRVSGFGAEHSCSKKDVTYMTRRGGDTSSRGLYAQIISRMILGRSDSFYWGRPLTSDVWELLASVSTVHGPGHKLKASWPKYDVRYIQEGPSFVAQNWPSLHRALCGDEEKRLDKYAVIMWLCTLSCSDLPQSVLGVLVSFYTIPLFASIFTPEPTAFHMRHEADVCRWLKQDVRSHLRAFHASPEAKLRKDRNETRSHFGDRTQRVFQDNRERAASCIEARLKKQWPCKVPVAPQDEKSQDWYSYVDKDQMMTTVTNKFSSCFNNLQLLNYLDRVLEVAHCIPPISMLLVGPSNSTLPSLTMCPGFVSRTDLFCRPAPRLSITHVDEPRPSVPTIARCSQSLHSFIAELDSVMKSSRYEKEYAVKLKRSLSALENDGGSQPERVPCQKTICEYDDLHRVTTKNISDKIMDALIPTKNSADRRHFLSQQVGQFPRLGTEFLLRALSHSYWKDLDESWRKCIITFGMALASSQRAERLALASATGKTAELAREWQHEAHTNWHPMEYPESLLLEIESGITIRAVQEQIAAEMRQPSTDGNASMQLNMGEGKSSVIVPMVAAALADGSRLVRVIVAKPQSKQMAQMLIAKLGGLLDRRVFYMPFSRSLRVDQHMAKTLHAMCEECKKGGGVLLVQPEHLLSFQLMALERSIGAKKKVARPLLNTLKFFNDHARDIVDESDENFNVRFELIYTMGVQRQLEFCPDRWTTIAEVLQLVKELGPNVAKALPNSMQIDEGPPGSFPRTRILRLDAGNLLVDEIAKRICETGLPGFPISQRNQVIRSAVFKYITQPNLSEEEIALVEDESTEGFWTEAVRPKLLLLRGLLACGILVFALYRKRWSVNYGLDFTRTPPTRLAVPYRAKDQPSPRSDFSHPDVTILLTYLSYYYGHLRDGEIYTSFEHLMASDHRDIEYQDWTKDLTDLPEEFRHLQGINLEDGPTCTSAIFPGLSKSKAVADFYLSNVVFPKELRVFPHKLCASGWDIGRTKNHPTTAFSGTCDSYPLLPLDVTQLDLPRQQHTNARVLEYLLLPGNSVALLPMKSSKEASESETLLSAVMSLPHIPRVILDVGAQILDLSNEEMARTWLQKHDPKSAEAIIFFNDHDELMVLDRDGHIESLQTSPFAARMEVCLVFLDEAHTRGTDLKLPIDFRAAVTLGPHLTKDRLVQACMRMRQLGKGQTVVFMIPTEIQTKIRDWVSIDVDVEITVSHVLRWSISETHEDVRRSMPLWAKQGKNFDRQQRLWATYHESSDMSQEHASLFLEDEAKALEERYRPSSSVASNPSLSEIPINSRLTQIADRCQQMEMASHMMNTMEEEQEKELSPEMQEERQKEKIAAATPAKHSLHADVVKFAVEGVFIDTSAAYKPAFASLTNIGAAADFDVTQLVGDELYVTSDFAKTIVASPSDVVDSYLRSVQWIITLRKPTSAGRQRTLIVSPYEAQKLMPELRKTDASVLDIYKSRWNMNFPALNRLNFFSYPNICTETSLTPPEGLLARLDLFAGRTHFANFNEYVETCKLLGLASRPLSDANANADADADAHVRTSADGFIIHDARWTVSTRPLLRQSPVAFIRALTNIRTHYRDFAKTDMGKMLGGVLLTASGFGEDAT